MMQMWTTSCVWMRRVLTSPFTSTINWLGRLRIRIMPPARSGFYVESFDSPNTHIHFDDLTIRNYEAPQPDDSVSRCLTCRRFHKSGDRLGREEVR